MFPSKQGLNPQGPMWVELAGLQWVLEKTIWDVGTMRVALCLFPLNVCCQL